jgi:anti-anti-sigma factor
MIETVVTAPVNLGAETRVGFRENALAALEQLEEGETGGRIVVDLSATRHIDSAGLGALVMLQLRAADRKQSVCLRGASQEIRFLLEMTRLAARFVIEP